MSWATIKTKIMTDLASGSVLTQEYEIGGVRRKFQSLSQVRDFLDYAADQSANETSTQKTGRIYARNKRL